MLLFRLHGERLFPFLNRFKKKPAHGACSAGQRVPRQQAGSRLLPAGEALPLEFRKPAGEGSRFQTNGPGTAAGTGGTSWRTVVSFLGSSPSKTPHSTCQRAGPGLTLSLAFSGGQGVTSTLKVFVLSQVQGCQHTEHPLLHPSGGTRVHRGRRRGGAEGL